MKYRNANIFRITSICLILLFLGIMSASITHAETFGYVTQWGSKGTSNGQFSNPNGIAVDSNGNIYVADTGNNCIQKFDKNGNYLTQWNSYRDKEFIRPTGVAVDTLGNIFVADQGHKCIVKLNSTGGYITQWGSEFIGDGTEINPTSIAVDASGYIFVSDTFTNSRILKFDSTGNCLKQWGSKSGGTANGKFHGITGVAVDSIGNVYVSEGGNNRVQKFNNDGVYLNKWGEDGYKNGEFNLLKGIAIDSLDNVYTCENKRIQKFDSNGNYLMQWGSSGKENGQFNSPKGIALDSSGNVYVLDTGNNRVQKFAPTSTPNTTATTSETTSATAPMTPSPVTNTPSVQPTDNLSNVTDGNRPNGAVNYFMFVLTNMGNDKPTLIDKISVIVGIIAGLVTIFGIFPKIYQFIKKK